MATASLPALPRSTGDAVRELLARQRVLGLYGLVCMAIFVPLFAASLIDPRQIGNVSIWLKPAKFFLSIGVFTATMAWFFGYWREEKRGGWLEGLIVGAILVASTFELFWITWQGAHSQLSHFNFSTLFARRMFNLMGVGAVSLVATCLPMAWMIARRPRPGIDPGYRLAVILGLILTFALGGSLGGYIAANGGHSVGPDASNIPLFAWNRIGGDLRIAHFAGMHAQQLLPIAATGLAALRIGRRPLWVALLTLVYAGIVYALWAEAVAGQPLLPR